MKPETTKDQYERRMKAICDATPSWVEVDWSYIETIAQAIAASDEAAGYELILKAVIEQQREALEWYGKEAAGAAIHMVKKDGSPDPLLAILTVLANDGGARAGKAIAAAQKEESNMVENNMEMG